jgi:hypothetical protein
MLRYVLTLLLVNLLKNSTYVDMRIFKLAEMEMLMWELQSE